MALNELNHVMRQRLDALANGARDGDDYPVTGTGRSQMPHLTEAVQSLMAEHEANERGGCPTCARILPAGKRLPRCRDAPCRIYLAARWALLGESSDRAGPDVP